MVWVKICGLKTERDVELARDCGADAVGVVVGAPSPRAVSPESARDMLGTAGDLETVMVTVWQGLGGTVELARVIRPTAIQLHGNAEPCDLARVKRTLEEEELGDMIITPIGIGLRSNPDDLLAICRSYEGLADRILLDTKAEDSWGGTGTTHDWETSRWLRETLGQAEVILAGGLNEGNVRRAVSLVRPFGVDVSTGVETAPGVKDPDLVRRFVCAAKEAG